jgi:hypothetical protein
MFYSRSTRGFYDTEIHGTNIPNDAVEITIEQYRALLEAQAQGQEIFPDNNGYPILGAQTIETRNYARKRELEYPPITDYLDGIVKGDQAQIDKYIADCQAVKAKYPK